jgi:iron complex outermembrane receptor protein
MTKGQSVKQMLLKSAAGAAMVGLSTPAYSQVGSGELEASDGDIVVTAQKREERIQDVPLAITVLTSQSVERSGALALRDIATSVPSLYFSQAQGPVQSNVAIRGIGSSGGVAGLEPSVGIYVDGVYLDRTSIGVADFNDIERIEVLRGPQGTLFGKNTPAGLINFITKRPSYTPGGDVSATIGNYGAYGATASLTGPVVDDRMAVRVSGFYRTRDGFLRNSFSNSDVNDLEAYGVRARVLWQPTDRLELLASYEHHVSNQNCCAAEFFPLGATNERIASVLGKPFAVPLDGDDLTVNFDGGFSYRHRINAYTLEANLELGGYTLTSISSLRDYRQKSFIDGDFSQLDFFRQIFGNRDHRQFSQELRLASPADRTLSFVSGIYYLYKRQNERGGATYGADTARIFGLLGGTLAALAPTYTTIRSSLNGSDIINRSYAAFGQGMVKFSDKFDVSIGVRYTFDEKSVYSFQSTTEQVPVLAAPRDVRAADDDGKFSGVINARFRPDRDTLFYASLTRGYKSFGFNDSAINEAIGQRRFFDAETSTGGEVGLKKKLDALQLNVTGFYTVFDGYQASSFAPGNTFLLQNAGKLTTKGVEVEAALRPAPGVQFDINYTYLDAAYDRFTSGPGLEGVSVTQDLSGKPLQDAPKHSINIVSQYDTPISNSLKAFVRGELSFRSKVFTAQNLDPLLVQPAHALVNARIGLGDGNWGLELWGRNLTNEIILYRGGTPPSIITTGSRIRFVGDPRTYGATARLSF